MNCEGTCWSAVPSDIFGFCKLATGLGVGGRSVVQVSIVQAFH